MPTPEVPVGESQIQEINKEAEFVVDEDLKKAGAQVVQKNFTAQVKSDKGAPLIQIPPTQVITVAPPAQRPTLISWAKGPITSSLTWLGAFWLRILKKALHFGWSVKSEEGHA
jgi:hypothetical protein